MSESPMRGHFRYLRFKTFPTTPKTPQCEVFCPLLSSSKHSGVPEDSQPPTFPSVGLHPHTWPKWGCDSSATNSSKHFTPTFIIFDLKSPKKFLNVFRGYIIRHNCTFAKGWDMLCVRTSYYEMECSHTYICFLTQHLSFITLGSSHHVSMYETHQFHWGHYYLMCPRWTQTYFF